MKQNKKVFLVALLIGFGVIYFYNSKFDTTIVTKALAPEATIIYVGAYNDLDKANLKKEEYPEAIIYNNENVYKVVIGLYSKKEVGDLIKGYFLDQNINFQETKIKVNNTLIKNIENYELLIKNSTTDYYTGLINSILNYFKAYLS